MQFDDRLATVLRSDVGGPRAARTQFRQLLDLLGTTPDEQADLPAETYRQLAEQVEGLSPAEIKAQILRPAIEQRDQQLLVLLGYHRLGELAEAIPSEERSRIIREPGLRLRNRRLLAFLAEGDAKPAAAAVATASLSEEDWLTLIPQLPVMARGFLRHRRDLPQSVKELLAQMGVRDNVLPLPESAIIPEEEVAPATTPAASAAASPPAPAPESEASSGIRELRQRIEAFREARKDMPAAPRLPLGDVFDAEHDAPIEAFGFATDRHGRIDWADDIVAPLVVGMKPAIAGPGTIAVLDEADQRQIDQRQVLRGIPLAIDATEAISGNWLVDAAPQFSADGGGFAGYAGRMRRLPEAPSPEAQQATRADNAEADRMRQVLHELRTPVNAIQGFAEIIQQQIFGHAPNEYRAHAAAIAVDAAKLLAGFDEMDRISKLETGALELDEGSADMREAVQETITRLDGVLRARNSGFALSVKGDGFTTALDRAELLAMCWRIFASLASALAPSEVLKVKLASDGQTISMRCRLPASLAASGDIFASPVPDKRPAISAGMFGSGFSMRLARAEFRAAGGEFKARKARIMVKLPVLTDAAAEHSTQAGDDNAA